MGMYTPMTRMEALNSCTRGPCYTFFRGETVSTIDYIITDAISAPLVHSCSTLDHDPLIPQTILPVNLSTENDSFPTHVNWKRGLCVGSIDLSVASHAVGFCINEEKVICYQLELGK